MVEIPCRKYNALGLATVRLIAELFRLKGF